jgi:hypothetical protein
MFSFGVVWLLMGLFRGRPSPAWLRVTLLITGIALGGSIATLGLRASSMPRNPTPLTAQQLATNRSNGQRFYLVFGIEMAAIFVVVAVLRVIHYADYILCAIAIIVGAHFFPLAPLFGSPVYYATASLGCAIGVVGFFMTDPVRRQKLVGLSFGVLLWATAAWFAWSGLSTAS